MDYILKPLSIKAKVSKGKTLRFAEQSWLVLYYSVSFTSGLVSIRYHWVRWIFLKLFIL
jgi:acyl-CoA-dependent ceramide synthase